MRLERGLNRKQAADLIGVTPITITHWEEHECERLQTKQWPKVIVFLGYCPYKPCLELHQKVSMYRKLHGWSSKEFAGMVDIDEATLLKYEAGGKLYLGLQEKIAKYYYS